MTLLNEADAVYLGSPVKAVYAGTVKVWPPDSLTTPLLDDFNRANEGPPPSASWIASGFNGDVAGLKVVNNQVMSGISGTSGNIWGQKFTGPHEAYCDICAPWESGNTIPLWVGVTDDSVTNLASAALGYNLSVDANWGMWKLTAQGANYSHIQQLTGYLNPVTYADLFNVGDSVGIRVANGVVTGWHKPAGGKWYVFVTMTDSTYGPDGYIGLEIGGSLVNVDNFGGGSIGRAIDNFNRTENPLSNGGKWDTSGTFWEYGATLRADGSIATTAYLPGGYGGVSGWTDAYTVPVELLIDLVTLNGYPPRVYFAKSPSDATVYGYGLQVMSWTSVQLYRIDGGSSAAATIVTAPWTFAIGDTLIYRITAAGVHQASVKRAGTETLLGQGTDTTYTDSPLYPVLACNTSGLDNFSAGNY